MNSDYTIHPVPLCTVDNFPRANLHWLLPVPSNERVREGHYVWYIRGPRSRYLVDAGVTPERFIARRLASTPIQTLDEGLHRLGLEVGDIDYVILTHSHYDHSSDLRRFYNAKAIIQYSELQQIEHPFGYLKPRLPPDFAGIFKGVRWEIVDGDTRLDSQLELLLTPGHSAGGQSVSVRTHKGTEVITGWCCMQENFAPPLSFQERGYPFTINASHTNPVELYESTQRIIDLADVIIPCHEYRPKEP